MKNPSLLFRNGAILFATGLSASLIISPISQAAKRQVIPPPASNIPVRQISRLASDTAFSERRFVAPLRYGDEAPGLGSNALVSHSESLRQSGAKSGDSEAEFRRLITPNDQNFALSGSLIALNSNSFKSSNARRLSAINGESKNRLKFITIGARTNLLIRTLNAGDRITGAMLDRRTYLLSFIHNF